MSSCSGSNRLQGILRKKLCLKGRYPSKDTKSDNVDEELIFFRGDTLCLVIEVLDPDGVPIDITNANVRFTLREDEFSTGSVLNLDIEQGQYITKLSNDPGLVEIKIPAEITALFKPIDYMFDVQLIFDDGHVGTIIRNWLSFVRDMTR